MRPNLPGLRFLRRGAEALSPAQQYRQTDAGVVAPVGGTATCWLLARSQYRVKALALPHVAANRRDAAIRLEMNAWSPFTRTAHYAIPQADGALLMAWDADLVESLMAAQGVADRELPVLPETAWRSPAGEGLALMQCLEGVEAVVTSSGNVQSSVWWQDPPGEQDWANFLRTSALDAALRTQTPPTPSAPAWLTEPLGYGDGQASQQMAGGEIQAIAAIAFVLAVATLWFANDWRRYAMAQSASEQRLKATEQELDGILGARGTALTSLGRTEKLSALFNGPDTLNLLATLSRQLSVVAKPGTLQMSDFDWREHHLSMVLQTTGEPLSATRLVKALEAVPTFHDVHINDADGGRTRVELRVDALAPATDTANATNAAPAPAAMPAIPGMPGFPGAPGAVKP